MTVTIVTPSLNQARFLETTIRSVLAQQGADLEYIVIDGGSVDGTLDILHHYSGRLRWESRPDRGQSSAINRGWALGTGDVLAWLNADDVYLPGTLERVARFFDENPGAEWVYGDCDYLDDQGRILKPYPTQRFDLEALVVQAVNFIPQPSTFVRRRLVEKAGPLDDDLHFVLDFEYWIRIGCLAPAGLISEKLSGLRIHSGAKSVRALPGFGDELVKVYRRLFSSPVLPDSIQQKRRKALAQASYLAADAAYWGSDVRRGRRHALEAWLLAFPRLPRGLVRLSVMLLAEPLGLRLASGSSGNPYSMSIRT